MANNLMLNVFGFPAANRDLTVEVRDPITSDVVRTARPFLDGTVRLPGIDPGAYELAILHPNLALPVVRRPIRILPSGDTRVSVVIDPSQFRNTPIEDIPDANLGPVRDTVTSIGETALPLSHKQAGEAIRSDDWNTMAGAVHDLASAVAELTRLVSPTGHDHPELVAKFDEMSSNFDQLVNTLSTSMTELQRQIQAQRFRRQIDDLVSPAASTRYLGAAVHARRRSRDQRHRLAVGLRPPGSRGRPAAHRRRRPGARDPAGAQRHAGDRRGLARARHAAADEGAELGGQPLRRHLGEVLVVDRRVAQVEGAARRHVLGGGDLERAAHVSISAFQSSASIGIPVRLAPRPSSWSSSALMRVCCDATSVHRPEGGEAAGAEGAIGPAVELDLGRVRRRLLGAQQVGRLGEGADRRRCR